MLHTLNPLDAATVIAYRCEHGHFCMVATERQTGGQPVENSAQILRSIVDARAHRLQQTLLRIENAKLAVYHTMLLLEQSRFVMLNYKRDRDRYTAMPLKQPAA
jgi:hypothetical protein